MRVHLIDGTYELFRHFYAVPKRADAGGNEVGAVRGVLNSVFGLLRDGATHVALATDHVVESFRNELWDGYKHGEGIDPDLLAQFHPMEDAVRALGVTVWGMVEFEADDAMAAAAAKLTADSAVEQIFICTPDKDLAQCVVGDRVVQFDRRAGEVRNATAIEEKFGVPPAAIPDYLALVGDTADGFPGVPGWGAKSVATVLGRYGTLEAIPQDCAQWDIKVRGAERLAGALREHWDNAVLFRELATLRTDALHVDGVAALQWNGPTAEFAELAERLGVPALASRASRLAEARQA
ncbi:MAG: flap endonuclease [Acidobacteria bacterium]|nr:flap endonuclease [Acidobacteriota bacterium]